MQRKQSFCDTMEYLNADTLIYSSKEKFRDPLYTHLIPESSVFCVHISSIKHERDKTQHLAFFLVTIICKESAEFCSLPVFHF